MSASQAALGLRILRNNAACLFPDLPSYSNFSWRQASSPSPLPTSWTIPSAFPSSFTTRIAYSCLEIVGTSASSVVLTIGRVDAAAASSCRHQPTSSLQASNLIENTLRSMFVISRVWNKLELSPRVDHRHGHAVSAHRDSATTKLRYYAMVVD